MSAAWRADDTYNRLHSNLAGLTPPDNATRAKEDKDQDRAKLPGGLGGERREPKADLDRSTRMLLRSSQTGLLLQAQSSALIEFTVCGLTCR